MKHLLLTLLLTLSLTGCDGNYVKPTHWEDVVIITRARSNNPNADCRNIESLKDRGPEIGGCATWKRMSKQDAIDYVSRIADRKGYVMKCETIIPPIKFDGDRSMMTAGHEDEHCFMGNFHK